MDNLAVIAAWKAWATSSNNFAGDVTAADPDASFWFATGTPLANRYFHVFASGGDGSLIAVWSPEGGDFARGAVVFLGHEGDVFPLAEDVPHALALVAASGEDFEGAVTLDGESIPDADLAAWIAAQYHLPLPEGSVRDAVVDAATRVDGERLLAQVEVLNRGGDPSAP